MVKAVCECKEFSEDNLVIALKRSRFQFITEWSALTSLMAIILILLTGGVWIGAIIGYKFSEIMGSNEHNCQFCNSVLNNKSLRA